MRDQISFPYVVRKTGTKVNYIPGAVGDVSLFLRRKHSQNTAASKCYESQTNHILDTNESFLTLIFLDGKMVQVTYRPEGSLIEPWILARQVG